MNIGMVVHAYYLKDARVRRYAELLAAEGHNVDIICLREGDEPKQASHLGVNIYRIGVTRKRGGQLSYAIEYVASFLRFFARLNMLVLSGNRYDVLHIHNMPDFLVFCALFQRLTGTKVVLDIHDLMSEVYQSKYALEHKHWLPRLLRFQERWSTRFANAVITANHAFADILVERGVPEAKVSVVMNAANSQFFLTNAEKQASRAGRREDVFQVIYIGTLAPRYGLETGIQALGKIHRDGAIPNLRFSIIPKIANEGFYVDDVLSQIDKAGLKDVFELMDPVPHEHMPSVIAAADAMIYTPIPDIHMDIALSLKIPEAIAVGCPIVASRLEVNVRYFGEDALYMFEPGNVEQCVAGVLDVYGNPEKTAAKIEHAKSKLAEIGWDRQAQTYKDMLAALYPESAARSVDS